MFFSSFFSHLCKIYIFICVLKICVVLQWALASGCRSHYQPQPAGERSHVYVRIITISITIIILYLILIFERRQTCTLPGAISAQPASSAVPCFGTHF
ncbi:hypothetical protein T492DRAFT_1102891 [Pavlovales sp. CCMP2436]|nr:hypothetical protein T492DRAFT_1102891 [Pavlovales sp. CCMP2436]